jgi:hypothetical protein
VKVHSAIIISPLAATIAVALVASSTAVHAYKVTEAQRKACTPDVYRLCKSEIPNVERIVACMKANRSRLSPECEAVVPAVLAANTTRSIGETTAEWCAFTPGTTDPVELNWKIWCGPAAH